MEEKTPRPMTPFDELTVSEQLRILKLLLPYVPDPIRFSLGIWIKISELQSTIFYFRKSRDMQKDFSRSLGSPADVFSDIAPYLSPENAELFGQIRSIMDMMDTLETFQDMDPSFVMNMFSSGSSENTGQKGDSEYERMDEQSASEEYCSGETGTDPDGGR